MENKKSNYYPQVLLDLLRQTLVDLCIQHLAQHPFAVCEDTGHVEGIAIPDNFGHHHPVLLVWNSKNKNIDQNSSIEKW